MIHDKNSHERTCHYQPPGNEVLGGIVGAIINKNDARNVARRRVTDLFDIAIAMLIMADCVWST